MVRVCYNISSYNMWSVFVITYRVITCGRVVRVCYNISRCNMWSVFVITYRVITCGPCLL